jgi:small-conductance mechanosensitive channel
MVVSMSWAYLLMYIPLLIASSCVIGASRHENRELIIKEIISNAVRITTFMLVIYAVLQVVSWMV